MSATAKKILALGIAAVLFPAAVFASPTSVDRLTDHIEPLIKTDFIKGLFFTATSTTASSTLPKLSSTIFGAATICLTGDTCRTTWPSGGSGSGAVATSSAETSGRIPFYTSTAAFPALLSGGNSTFTFDGTRLNASYASTTAVSGTTAYFTSFIGALTGNASTATALAANGTNCSAGNYPLGVDASGNSENCTAAGTGTVTSVATGNGLTGGTITGSGTLSVDQAFAFIFTAASTTHTGHSSFATASTSQLSVSGTSWLNSLTLTTALTVANGGTGQSTFTASQLLYGNGTNALSSVATTSATVSTGLAYSGTFGALVGGSAGNLTVDQSTAWIFTAASTTHTQHLSLNNASTSQFTITGSSWLGTPLQLVGTNITGTASGFTAGNVTTNANLTGEVTSVGNAAVLGSFTSNSLLTALTNETGTGVAVFGTLPTITGAYLTASSTVTSGLFSMNGGASTTQLTISGASWLGTPSALVLTNATGLPVAGGGTGAATLTGCLTGNGTGAITGSGTCYTGSGANPTASVGLTAVNGVSTSFMRADAAPALDQSAAFIFTGASTTHTQHLSLNNASTSQFTITGSSWLGTPLALVLTNATGLPLSTGVTGTLPIANGGTATTTKGNTNGIWYNDGTTFTNSSFMTYVDATKLFTVTNASTTNLTALGSFAAATTSLTANITLSAVQPATSTPYTLNWGNSGPQVELQIGNVAFAINIVNATTSAQWGSRKLVVVCNSGGTAGALTWTGVEWIGAAPTQTTTTNQCDVYSFFVTRATSTSAYKVAGSQGAGFQ